MNINYICIYVYKCRFDVVYKNSTCRISKTFKLKVQANLVRLSTFSKCRWHLRGPNRKLSILPLSLKISVKSTPHESNDFSYHSNIHKVSFTMKNSILYFCLFHQWLHNFSKSLNYDHFFSKFQQFSKANIFHSCVKFCFEWFLCC